MHSPVHSEVQLQLKEIEPGLSVYECPKSGGIWIPLDRYYAWKESHQNQQRPLPENYKPVIADDSKQRALLCPESGRLLIRYKVGHGLDFHINLSPVTGGVWLDRGEWDALKSKGLASQLHLIFTASYQRQVRNEEYQQALTREFEERIGAADFQKVAAFKSWLTKHPKQRDISCYLMDHSEGDAK